MKCTALHADAIAMTHAPLAPLEVVPAACTHMHTHTQPESFYVSIRTKHAVFPFSVMLSSPPAVLFNKSLSAHLSPACVRMCIYACAAWSRSQPLAPAHPGRIRTQSSKVSQTASSPSCLSFAHSHCLRSWALALRRQSQHTHPPTTPNINLKPENVSSSRRAASNIRSHSR